MWKTRVLAFAVAAAFVLSAPAFADNDNAAIVLKDLDHPVGCSLGIGGPPPLFTTDEIQTVATSSGNVKLTCHFNIPEGFEPATAVRFTGFSCGIFLPPPAASVFTTDTMAVRTPGGRATLVCQFKPSGP